MEISRRIVTIKSAMIALLAIASVAAFAQSANQKFFPKSTFSTSDKTDEEIASRYVAQLKALHEPSLLELTDYPISHSFRFLWLRTFNHPIALRLTILDESGVAQLTVKVADGRGGYDPGSLIVNKSLPVSVQEVQGFLKLVDQSKFWKLAAKEEIVQSDGKIVVTTDGANWVIEGVQSKRYHLVDRSSPPDGDYRNMALELLRLSGLKDEKIY